MRLSTIFGLLLCVAGMVMLLAKPDEWTIPWLAGETPGRVAPGAAITLMFTPSGDARYEVNLVITRPCTNIAEKPFPLLADVAIRRDGQVIASKNISELKVNGWSGGDHPQYFVELMRFDARRNRPHTMTIHFHDGDELPCKASVEVVLEDRMRCRLLFMNGYYTLAALFFLVVGVAILLIRMLCRFLRHRR